MNKKIAEHKKLVTICTLALLTAMQVVIARFLMIPIGEMGRISFSFIPVVIAAKCYGILGGVAVYGLGDFIGAIAFPTTGAYFPGYTLTAVIAGFIFGLFLRDTKSQESKKIKTVKIILSVLLTQFLCSFLLNSFWRSFQSGVPFGAVLLTRVPQCLIISAVQIAFMIAVLPKVSNIIRIKS